MHKKCLNCGKIINDFSSSCPKCKSKDFKKIILPKELENKYICYECGSLVDRLKIFLLKLTAIIDFLTILAVAVFFTLFFIKNLFIGYAIPSNNTRYFYFIIPIMILLMIFLNILLIIKKPKCLCENKKGKLVSITSVKGIEKYIEIYGEKKLQYENVDNNDNVTLCCSKNKIKNLKQIILPKKIQNKNICLECGNLVDKPKKFLLKIFFAIVGLLTTLLIVSYIFFAPIILGLLALGGGDPGASKGIDSVSSFMYYLYVIIMPIMIILTIFLICLLIKNPKCSCKKGKLVSTSSVKGIEKYIEIYGEENLNFVPKISEITNVSSNSTGDIKINFLPFILI